MATFPNSAKEAAISVPELNNWNTDRSGDVPVMLRGFMIKGPDGWQYSDGDMVKYTTHLDDTGGAVIYIGKAQIGSATSAAVWQIERLSTTSAGYIYMDWAGGNDEYDNVFDNRAIFTYS